jgi:predicted  nucleic acid-binding Zn-ribbon protein
MDEHDERASELEREASDMEQRSGHLEDEIEAARDDWARKKRDSSVPGAPEHAEQGQQPETSSPSEGDED